MLEEKKKKNSDDDGEPQQEFTYKKKTPRQKPEMLTDYSEPDDGFGLG
ncbi:MAG: hypothetical protein HFJ98_03595 [Eubacterium sp.]|nr:hypothetical protein [Eubacterium sp.]